MHKQKTLTEAVKRTLESFSLGLHVALPGVVRSYDNATQTAEIEPGVQRVILAEDEEEGEDTPEGLPILPAVLVLWPRAGSFFLHFPLVAGDSVMLLFSESDINEWRKSGGVVDPGVPARHGLSGAVAIPGMYPQGSPIASNSAPMIGHDSGIRIEFTQLSIKVGGDSDAAALASKVDALQTNMNTMIALYNAHVHVESGGSTAPPTGPPASSSSETFPSSVLKVSG